MFVHLSSHYICTLTSAGTLRVESKCQDFLPELHRCGGGEFVERYRQQAGQHGKASLYCKTTVSVCLCVQFEILCSLFLRVSLRATELIPNFKIDECKKLFASLLKGEQRLLTWTHTLTHTHTHSHTHTHTHTHSYLMHNVHSKVFPAICGVHSKQDKDLVHRCHALRPHLTPTRVGVPSDYNCQYTKTLAHLNKMEELESPLEKLYGLQDAMVSCLPW